MNTEDEKKLNELFGTLKDLQQFHALKIGNVQEFAIALVRQDEAFWRWHLLDKLSPAIRGLVAEQLFSLKSRGMDMCQKEQIVTMKESLDQLAQIHEKDIEESSRWVDSIQQKMSKILLFAREQLQGEPNMVQINDLMSRLDELNSSDCEKNIQDKIKCLQRLVDGLQRAIGQRRSRCHYFLTSLDAALTHVMTKTPALALPPRPGCSAAPIPPPPIQIVVSPPSCSIASSTPQSLLQVQSAPPGMQVKTPGSQCPTEASSRKIHGKKRRSYECEECGKVYFSSSGLKSHMYTHTGEWPFQCKFCQRGFSSLSTAKAHERRHNGPKPYICPKSTCGKGFSTKAGLEKHLARTHRKHAVI